MGLSIVKDIVESFSGTVKVSSNNKRTSFEIVIPKRTKWHFRFKNV